MNKGITLALRRRAGLSRRFFASDPATQFAESQARLKSLSEDPGNAKKLQLYALFKQATQGENTTPKPGMMDFVGKAKWDAWKELGSITKEEAMQKYAAVVTELAGSEPPPTETEQEGSQTTTTEGNLIVRKEGRAFIIQFNRPTKYNAITWGMYDEIGEALRQSDADKTTSITVIQGSGDYFSSGNDLSNFMEVNPADRASLEDFAERGRVLFKRYVDNFIDHQKPLIALVNGPAIGISVTILGIFDLVYCSDKATFVTPFASLGQTPEGCSSFTFPRIMGDVHAKEFLLFGKKLSATEANERGLVSEVFPHESFQTDVMQKVQQCANLPPKALKMCKGMVMDAETRAKLKQVNADEAELLRQSWLGEECHKAIMDFFTRKQK